MDGKPATRKGPDFCSLRYGLALIMHFSNFTMITQRVSLSIAIIAMVNTTQQHGLSNASTEGPVADALNNSSISIKEFDTKASVYQWSPETQGIIFSSINYGIILTLIPSGYLAGIFGAKKMLGAGLLISSLLTLFTPLAADFGVILVIVVRTVQGMAQGMAWTGQFTIWAKWAPPLERSKLTTIAGSGSAFGSFIILCVGGLISQALGWPFIFYIFGSTGCVCCLLWFTVIYDDPMHHPCISVREKEHIVSSLAQQSGVLSSLPFIAAASCTILGGQLADFLLSRNLLRLITVRKLFSSFGLLLPSICAVALPFVASSYVITIILLILIPGTSNLCDSGFIINTLDIAPRYASFLMGISRGFGLIAGIISSTATGFLISQDFESGWRNVFFLSAAVNMFGLVFYVTFGQAELQDWAKERTLTRL
ncbi:sodium-dependent phosphate transport protein 3 isoform X3 [Rhinopithecus roxellana]|uniref:sodium-dependent phosphate transport protein 3 isoform X3 n=1 Tax=Rhinopithecus roxellana TaxID=61622 RepID=UPI0005330603|nr:sodium-dependent phosphate transport protein 3 isoform X3 [Rhinopithecus roxellana]